MGVIRTPFVSGTVLNNPLASGGTTLSSAALAALAAITAPDIAKIILDPAGSAGAPDVAYVTAHTGAATTATISRSAEGSTARQHAVGTPWIVGPTALDFGWTSSPATPTAYNPLQDWWEMQSPSAVVTLGGSVGVANTAYGVPMRALNSDASLTDILINVTVQSGNIDVGLYQYDGTTFTKIVSLGSTACPAATQYTANITDTTVYKGTRYYIWVAADNATAAFTRLASVSSPGILFPHYSKATSFPLPATIASASASALGVAALGSLVHG